MLKVHSAALVAWQWVQIGQITNRASAKDAHWAPPLGGVPVTTSREENSGNTQD